MEAGTGIKKENYIAVVLFLSGGITSTIKVKFQSNRFHLFSCKHTVYQVFSI